MNLAEIETFLMIVKTKNITKTANGLFLSQPTISHRLKLLEEELQVKLIIRKKGFKQIELTPQGESFIPIAERWVSVWQEMQRLKNAQETLYLTIGCTDTLNSVILFDLYKKMLQEERHLMTLRIKTHYSREIYDLLEKHEIDLGFVYHHLHFKSIVAEPVLRERMYIVQSSNPRIKKPSIHIDELDRNWEIFVSWEDNFQIWHDEWVSKGQDPRVQVDTFELLLHLLADDRMWTIAPASVAERLQTLRDVYVSEIENSVAPPERITYMIKHKYQNDAALKSIDVFENKLNDYLKTKSWNYNKHDI